MSLPLLAAQAPYFVEIIGRHGEIKARHRFDRLPISIGSSYANEVILDDADVASFHAVVEASADGGISIRESGSQRGLSYQGKTVKSLPVDGHHIVGIGHAQVRVRSAAFVANASAPQPALKQHDGWVAALLGLALIIAFSLFDVWLEATTAFSLANQLLAIASILAMVLLWSGGWAFATRVISGTARFGRHILIVCCGLAMLDVWSGISHWVSYAFSLESISAYRSHVMMVIAAVMIFYHLSTISQQHPKRFSVICGCLMLLGSGLVLLSNHQRNGYLADELYMKHLLPPSVRLTGNTSAEAFMQNAQTLKPKVDAERLEDVDSQTELD